MDRGCGGVVNRLGMGRVTLNGFQGHVYSLRAIQFIEIKCNDVAFNSLPLIQSAQVPVITISRLGISPVLGILVRRTHAPCQNRRELRVVGA